MSIGELPPEALSAGLHEADEQELDDDLSVLQGETGVEVETEIAREEDARDTRIDLLEGLREMQGADAVRWRLYRVNDDDPRRNGFLDEIATGQLTQKWIRDSFGGGTYRVRGYHVASGKFKAGRTIRIAGDAPKKGNDSVTGPATNGAFNLQEYLAQQDSRDTQRRREEEERRERQREEDDRKEERRRKNFLEMITAVGALVSPIVAQMVGKKDDTAALIAALRPRETNPLEMLQLLREMRELERPQQSQTNILEQAMGMLERFKDLGAFPGAGNGEVSWLDIGREAIKALGPSVGQGIQSIMEGAAAAKALEAQRAGQAPLPAPGMLGAPGSPVPRLAGPQISPATATAPSPAGSARFSPATSAGTAVSPSTSQTTQGDEEMLKLLPLLPWLKGETERLLVAAARGSDPELRAASMFDDMPDNADIEAVGQVLSRSDWFQLFTALDSRVAQYEPWFAEVRGTLLTLIAEETGVSYGARSDGGVTQSGRQVVNVQGPAPAGGNMDSVVGATVSSRAPSPAGPHFEPQAPARQAPRRDPNAEIERPSGPPSLTGE